MKDRVLSLGLKFTKHELISGSFYVFLGSMFANFLAFLLNVFFARSLSYADYAIFASMLSVITLASIPAGSMNTIIVKFAANYFAKHEPGKAAALYKKTFKYILYVSIALIFGLVFFGASLKNFLHLDSIYYVILAGSIVILSYFSILNNAFIQSLLKFKFLSLMSIASGIIKLAVGIILVFMGYRAFGALGSIFFMALTSFLIGYIPLKNILIKNNDKVILIAKKEIFSYAVPVSITIFFLTSFVSMDVILVKHFFNPHEAGFYAGLSLIGKVIFYFTAPVPIVMFPLVVKRHSTGKNFNSLFYLALILVALPSLLITAFYFIFPEIVINMFLGGGDYLMVAKYLGFFGLFLTVFSLINVCVNFFLSLNMTKIAPVVVGSSILQTILIFLYHNNFYEIIGVSLTVSTALLVFLLFYYYKNFVV